MKIGVSYNLFDGEELLKPSIMAIRDSVDFISVIFQDKSNFNQKNEDIKPFLRGLMDKNIIDEAYHYEPDLSLLPQQNELLKRNLGLSLSRFQECTHHLSIDVDEFYVKDQFDSAKKYIEYNNINVSVCQMQSYYKKPTLQITPPEDYFVTFIIKIFPETSFILNGQFPVIVDPTRRVPIKQSFRIFERDDLEMHHMSYVRKNIRSKLENSSANFNFKENIDKLVSYYENYKEGEKAMFAGDPYVFHDVKKVENQFKIK